MGGEYPDNAFTAVVFKSDTSKFHDVKSWEGKVVEATGEVKEYRDKPEIVGGEGADKSQRIISVADFIFVIFEIL